MDELLFETIKATQKEFDRLAESIQRSMTREIREANKGFQTGRLEGAIQKKKLGYTEYMIGVLNEAPFQKGNVNYAKIYANGRKGFSKKSGYYIFKDSSGRWTKVRVVAPQEGNDFVGKAIADHEDWSSG